MIMDSCVSMKTGRVEVILEELIISAINSLN
jgi:hypothetical protein